MNPTPAHRPGDTGVEAHRARDIAESFGIDAERYDRARPRYPAALLDRILLPGGGRDILDVGCGTGIVAHQLLDRGCRVVGVDPDPRMARVARECGVEIETSTFETWDARGWVFDTVVAGQAWHRVDQRAGAEKAANVLRPGGRLVVFGYVLTAPPDVDAAFAEAVHRVAPDAPFNRVAGGDIVAVYQQMYDATADAMAATGRFAELQRWRFDDSRKYPRDQWLEHLATTGVLTTLAARPVADVLDRVGAQVDALGGTVTVQLTTLAVAAGPVN